MHPGLLSCQSVIYRLVALAGLTRVIQVDIVLSLRVAGKDDAGVGRHFDILVCIGNIFIDIILLSISIEVTTIAHSLTQPKGGLAPSGSLLTRQKSCKASQGLNVASSSLFPETSPCGITLCGHAE